MWLTAGQAVVRDMEGLDHSRCADLARLEDGSGARSVCVLWRVPDRHFEGTAGPAASRAFGATPWERIAPAMGAAERPSSMSL